MIEFRGFQRLTPNGWTVPLSVPIIHPGRLITIVGKGASGKTAFSKAVAGIADQHNTRGEIVAAGPERSRIAFVPNIPYLLFSGITNSLRDELRIIGPDTRFVRPSDIANGEQLLDDLVHHFRLRSLLSRDPMTLSGGEAARAAFAAAVIFQPDLLIVDQGYESLHPQAAQTVWEALNAYLPRHSTIIEMHARKPNRSRPMEIELANGWTWTDESRNSHIRRPLVSFEPDPLAKALKVETNPVCLEAKGLQYSYGTGQFTLSAFSTTIRNGDRIALVGPNGIGKTTLMKSMAMILAAEFDRMSITDRMGVVIPAPPRQERHSWAGYVRYCFQSPDDQIYKATVFDEIADRGNSCRERALQIAEIANLTRSLKLTPFDLTLPERRILTIASAICSAPRMILLDEPSVFLDDEQMQVLEKLIRLFLPKDAAVVAVTHDPQLVEILRLTPRAMSQMQYHR